MCIFQPHFWLTPQVVRRAAAVAACCAGSAGTSLLQVLLVFTSFQDTRHDFVRFLWSFLLLSISLLCCLFCIVSQATKILFFRSASRWSIGDEQGHRFPRFPAPRLLFNGAQFHSPEVRGFPRLLHCEQLVQQSRCFFSQWRAPCLFLSLRRRNHLVSDVDRRETGLFPGKSDVAVWIITLKKKFFQPFHPQSESATRKVHEDARPAQLAAALGTSPAGPHPDPSSTG